MGARGRSRVVEVYEKMRVFPFIDIFYYIFRPNVLKFRKHYGTINRGFPFQSGYGHRGDV